MNFQTQKILVPTIAPDTSRRRRDFDVTTLRTNDDLKALAKEDPFMYHSIPAVHKATLSHKDATTNSLESSSSPSSSSPSSSSSSKAVVSRKTRVSTESHLITLMPELLNGMFDDEDVMDEDGDDDQQDSHHRNVQECDVLTLLASIGARNTDTKMPPSQ